MGGADHRLDERRASLETAISVVDEVRSAISKLELEIGAVMEDGTIAKVAEARAGLEQARWSLERTDVRAPSDGMPTNVTLAAGQTVAALPLAPAMVFVDPSDQKLFDEIHQTHMRHVKVGQEAEVAFNYLLGQVFPGKIHTVFPLSQGGQAMVAGSLPMAGNIVPEPIFVRIELEDPEVLNTMPAGSVGNVAIFVDTLKLSHGIRKVTLRLGSILNYVDSRL